MRVKFIIEKETKNTVRYTELLNNGEVPVIGTLYVQKTAIREFEKAAGASAPEYLYVEITAG